MAYSVGNTLVRAIMTNDTGLPEDEVMNDFAFDLPFEVDASAAADLLTLVDGFYNNVQTSTQRVSQFISNSIDRGVTHRMEFYKIQSPSIGSPLFILPWIGPDTADATGALPNEVAVVLSFHSLLTGVQEQVGTVRPRARRRGRIYIGPLTRDAVTSTPNPILDPAMRTTLHQAALQLKDASQTDVTPWCVWSRQDEILREVSAGWTDNAPDTQRRRGQASTARTVWGP